jgi:hypothetical protein
MSRMGSISAAGDLSSLFGTSGAESPAASGPMGDGVDAVVDAVVDAASEAPAGEKTEGGEPAEGESDQSDAAEDSSVEAEASEEETGEAEASKEETPAEKKESEIRKINNQFRALSRKEAAISKREAAVAAKDREVTARLEKLQPLESLAKLGDLELLMRVSEMKGTPFKDLLRRAISHAATGEPEAPEETKDETPETDPAVLKVLEEVQSLKAKLEEKERQQAADYEQALLDNYVENCVSMITEDDFPILAGEEMSVIVADVLKYSEKYAMETKEAPDARELMEYLEAKYEKDAIDKSARLQRKKGNVKDRTVERETESTPPSPKGAGSPATQTKAAAPKALSNNMVSERGSGSDEPFKSDRERLREAAKFLETQKF